MLLAASPRTSQAFQKIGAPAASTPATEPSAEQLDQSRGALDRFLDSHPEIQRDVISDPNRIINDPGYMHDHPALQIFLDAHPLVKADPRAFVSPELLQGVLTCVASWGAKGHEALIAELKTRYKEPWMTQNAISTYGDMWVIKDALEKAGKADRVAVAEALRSMDAGPSKYYPLGEIKFDEKGRRVGAGMTIVQWQSGIPVTVFPPQLALAQPFWPKN